MRHHLFSEPSETYPIAVLMKATAFNQGEIRTTYVDPLGSRGVAAAEIMAVTLSYSDTNKAPAGFIKEYLAELLPALDSLGTRFLYVTDANYFKVLAGQTRAEPHFGYVLPCKVKGFEHMEVCLGVNYQQLIYNPDLQAKVDLSLDALASKVQGTYQALGSNIIHSALYPSSLLDIAMALESLHRHPKLACDIEAFSLRFNEAGIGTIAFAWDEHNGIAFACDYHEYGERPAEGYYGYQQINVEVRKLLFKFLCTYQGELTWHNSAYDVKVIIYTLWMQSLADTKGLLNGLDVMFKRIQDTKLIAYLATNSTAGNVLGLKPLAHEFAGNWAKDDIKDIRKIPLPELLQYNLVDTLSTNYVRNKYLPVLAAEQQEDIYQNLYLPSQKMMVQMELTGMPMSKKKLAEVKSKLEMIRATHLTVINTSKVIATMNLLMQDIAWEKDFEDRKAKAKNPGKIVQKDRSAFDGVSFNPNSGPQMQRLLYELMGLPVLDRTDSKQPATGADTIKKLINHTEVPEYKEVLQSLIGYGEAEKILSTFIPAFERGIEKAPDGIVWLFGSFNLGGAVSGRISSSDPNLTNIPANSTFGKLIKEIFVGPPGWIFAGADFNSLEDYVSALTTKDPNKLNVYIKGFDGHCLRAAYYFKEDLEQEGILIDLNDPKSVNSLKKMPQYGGKDHPLRQGSKAPTFLLTYGGTYHGMMSNLGWPQEKSMRIEANYHELYKVSDQYVAQRIKQASVDGYVTVAFGLRVRTPLLKQVAFGFAKMPYEAAAEGRTAGNALGQSYCMLTMRAMVEFMQKVWDSPYRLDILPAAMIHDANYLLIRDDVAIVEWANRELIKSMQWQELPEIQHPTVKLGAALDIFWPNWAHATTLPNNADQATILQLCQSTKGELLKKAA